MRPLAAALAFFCLTAAAAAADLSPLALYRAGRYEEAIRTGLAQRSAQGFAVAARAALAEERIRDTPCLACLERAEKYAREAIAADPKRAEGRVYLATSLGYQARIIGIMAAKLKGYAGEAKDNLDIANAEHPHDPWVLAALGGWNIAVVNGGGSVLADMLYGASLKKGLAYFAKAFAADPGNIVIRFHYALSLSSYDREAYAKEIAEALKATVTGKPRTAYEVLMQGRARILLDAFKRRDWTRYDASVKRYEGYPA
jgi:tetratricopeptide (TPR) repeat protein